MQDSIPYTVYLAAINVYQTCDQTLEIHHTLPFPASIEIIFKFKRNVYYIHLLASDILYNESMKFTATDYYKSRQNSNILGVLKMQLEVL